MAELLRIGRRPKPAIITGKFNDDMFLSGMRLLSGPGCEPVHTVHWAGRRGYVEPSTYCYRATEADAALACARAGRFEPGDSLALLNVVRGGVDGLPRAADIAAVRGHAVRLPFGPSWSVERDPDDAPATPTELLNLMHRLARAGAAPIVVVDPIGGAYWALWLSDRPINLSGDEQRKAAYRAQAGRLAAVVGGSAPDDALTAALPMPGVTDFRAHHPNRIFDVSVDYLSFSEILGHEVPRYGCHLEDLNKVIARIEAEPVFDLFAKGRV